ncbi:cation:proton antiporter [Myroides sp. LJL119]
MKKYKNTFLYVTLLGGCSLLMFLVVSKGSLLEQDVIYNVSDKSVFENFYLTLYQNLKNPLALLLAQIVTIVLVARGFGWFCKKIGQPSVIGEIVAGIALGPSFLGMHFPEFSQMIFPVDSLANLSFLSQIGLILFMFVIGMELDLKVLKNKAHDAIVISHASIIIPFTLGLTLAYYIFESFSPKGAEFLSFGLFLGISMSITAFPVLARIVQERSLHKTRIGSIAITCAAADDITAWCLLAAVIAIVQAGSFVSSLYTIALALIYVIVMLKLVKPFLAKVAKTNASHQAMSKSFVALFLIILIISSYATEVIGIHALFGAFMTGVIMPENTRFRELFMQKVEDVAVILFLPLFFVYTGLRTEIGLLNEPYLWKITGIIILVATVGKFIGSALTAKFVGINWKDSLVIGALMNTRGLMELIVLNIGFDLGVLTGEIFAMMVIMALATTFMTGPLLDLIDFIFKKQKHSDELQPQERPLSYQVTLLFDKVSKPKDLLKLAYSFVGTNSINTSVTAMNVVDSNEIKPYNVASYETEVFEPVLQQAQDLGQEIRTLYKASLSVSDDIVELINQQGCDLFLTEMGYSIYRGTLLGNILGFTTNIINPNTLLNRVTGKEKLFEQSLFDIRTQEILFKSQVPVGVFINKEFKSVDKVFFPVFKKGDLELLKFAQKWILNAGSQVTVLDALEQISSNIDFKEQVRLIEHYKPNHIRMIKKRTIRKEFIEQFDIMIISLDSWKQLVATRSRWLHFAPSILIIKN